MKNARILVFALPAAFLLGFVAYLENGSLDLRPEPGRLVAGDPFPTLSGSEVGTGETLVWPASAHPTWRLVLYLDGASDANLQRARYAELLRRRFASRGLDVALVIPRRAPAFQTLVDDGVVRYPVLVSRRSDLAPVADARHRGGTLFLVDPDGVIRFSPLHAGFDVEDMRQITEKLLLRHVTYPESVRRRVLRTGDTFPPLLVENLRNGHTEPLPQHSGDDGFHYVIFTPDCPSCSLEPSLQLTGVVEGLLDADGDVRMAALFSSSFSRTEVLSRADRLGLGVPLFRFLLSPDEPADQPGLDPRVPSGVAIVRVDEGGRIVTIDDLATFVRSLSTHADADIPL